MNLTQGIPIIIAALIAAGASVFTAALTVGLTLYFTRGKTGADANKANAEAQSTMQKLINEMAGQIEVLTGKVQNQQDTAREVHSIKRVVEQLERNNRIFYDELGIAYWEADKDGNCVYANQTFQDLTGLSADECKNCGWFDGILEADRNRIKYQWRSFISNTDTQFPFRFRFHNPKTGKSLEVQARGQAIYTNGFEIYKYTARTKPFNRNHEHQPKG